MFGRRLFGPRDGQDVAVSHDPVRRPWPKLGEGGVPALWDALPEISKWQIILFVGALEFWSEIQGVGDGEPHYMRGGKVGGMRSFKSLKLGIPDLYDPTGGLRNASEEKKARGRLVEINNGRLAMIGLFGFLAEAKVPAPVSMASTP
ncbi:chlorophyll A-B binding protein [Aureococcus anophagefferens]|nr:chlorophyll A-B binding protein [Aureococcus anophagefferens]